MVGHERRHVVHLAAVGPHLEDIGNRSGRRGHVAERHGLPRVLLGEQHGRDGFLHGLVVVADHVARGLAQVRVVGEFGVEVVDDLAGLAAVDRVGRRVALAVGDDSPGGVALDGVLPDVPAVDEVVAAFLGRAALAVVGLPHGAEEAELREPVDLELDAVIAGQTGGSQRRRRAIHSVAGDRIPGVAEGFAVAARDHLAVGVLERRVGQGRHRQQRVAIGDLGRPAPEDARRVVGVRFVEHHRAPLVVRGAELLGGEVDVVVADDRPRRVHVRLVVLPDREAGVQSLGHEERRHRVGRRGRLGQVLRPVDAHVLAVGPGAIGDVFGDDVGLFARARVVLALHVEVRRDREHQHGRVHVVVAAGERRLGAHRVVVSAVSHQVLLEDVEADLHEVAHRALEGVVAGRGHADGGLAVVEGPRRAIQVEEDRLVHLVGLRSIDVGLPRAGRE